MEARLGNTNPWIHVTLTNNRFYANTSPIPREDSSEDNFKGKTNMNDSNDEADLFEYDSDVYGPPHLCTLVTRERKAALMLYVQWIPVKLCNTYSTNIVK